MGDVHGMYVCVDVELETCDVTTEAPPTSDLPPYVAPAEVSSPFVGARPTYRSMGFPPRLPSICMHLSTIYAEVKERRRRGEEKSMAMVRERRNQQALRLQLPPLQQPSTESAYRFQLPSPPLDGSPDSPLVVDDLSDLEKLSVVGHGGGGTVYKVRCRHTSSLFALKVLRLDRNAVDAWQQAAREVDILMRVDSPYVVRCHGVVRGGKDRICLVMEYMASGSLRDLLLARRSLPEEVIAVVARRVLEGLRYLHGLGIVHRDIKPANLLVSERGEVKIADFGASRMARAPEGDESSCMGTCAYMSPERFDSEGFGGGGDGGAFAGDVWALGVVLLECYAGRFPLAEAGKSPDWASLMCMVCFDSQPEVSEAASPEFRSFARRCLEKEWRKRGTVEELLSHPFVATCSTTEEGLVDATVSVREV
ncbi:hypothetical protein GW17_00045572 [Ensete ventricosum]|nr:hypothetical protein GW17_00045572 [Ensete ventricosum]